MRSRIPSSPADAAERLTATGRPEPRSWWPADDPPIDLPDEAAALGGGQELQRRDELPIAVAHAQEQLLLDDGARRQLEDGLRVEHEAVLLERAADPRDPGVLVGFDDGGRAVRVVELGLRSAEGLGVVHRGVGLLEQPVRVAIVIEDCRVGDRDPEAGGHRHRAVADLDREVDDRGDALSHRDGVRRALQRGQEHHELIATEPRDAVHGAHGDQEPFGDLAQDRVAGGMAVRVVDLLEAVEVDEDQAGRLPRALGQGQGLGEAIDQQVAVGESRQGIVSGLLGQGGLRLLELLHADGLRPAEAVDLVHLRVLLCEVGEREAEQLLAVHAASVELLTRAGILSPPAPRSLTSIVPPARPLMARRAARSASAMNEVTGAPMMSWRGRPSRSARRRLA